jgi:membrane-associated phospholipid phosphatase
MHSDRSLDASSSASTSSFAIEPTLPEGRRLIVYAIVWAIAIVVVALLADARVASLVYSSRIYDVIKNSTLCHIIKTFGTFYIILAIIPLTWWGRFKLWRAAMLILGAAAISGLFYSVLKWTFGRSRPIGNGLFNPNAFQVHFFEDGWRGLFISRPDLSFPSGHASLAFAIATAFSICVPRLAAASYVVAVMVAVERVLEGAHYPSDVIAGAGCGILAALVAMRLCLALPNLGKSVQARPY